MLLIEVVEELFFKVRGNVFPDFRSNRCKSGSSLIIAYPKLILVR